MITQERLGITLKTKDPSIRWVLPGSCFTLRAEMEEKLKCIRTYNGGEYIVPFDAYCREHGIQHQKTPSKTPQLNGLAERMNRTLVERVRCLLSHAGVWSDKDVSYRHLRVFGCKASVHIPKDERSKLDVKGKPCVFLGYGQDEFGYRLYVPVQKKLVRSRDVVFEEDLTLKDVEKAEREIIPQHNDDLIDLDLVPPKHFDSQFGDDIQNDGDHDEEQGVDDVDAQEQLNLDEDVHPELPCYAEAMEDEHKKEWFEAMEDEMNSLHENNTFELVKLPKGKRALKNKWVYKLKTEEHTSRPRYKGQNWWLGFSQKRGIDFDEIFSPVVKMGSIRVVLGLAASLDLEVEQMDVKTAFLHGDLDKEIYMEQPEANLVKICPSSKKNIEKMDRVLYASAVGSLMYAMVCTRPDSAHTVGVVSRFLSNPVRCVKSCEEKKITEKKEIFELCLSNAEDRWSWSLSGHGEFLVKSASEVIYKHVLITSSTPTRWSKVLPIKLNVFMWCMLLNKLPTRSNLAIRGLDVPCSLCSNCRMGVETRDHLFFVCPMALDLFRLLGRWWNIQIPILLDSSTWESWLNSLRLNSLQKLVLEASFSSLWWHIWVFRNATLFSSKKPLK
ncbi:putative RNA-directed DNA polymerase [Tanacetum coccineum]